MKQAGVDRIEGAVAVLLIEDQPFNVPMAQLPHGVREGDYLSVEMSEGRIVFAERDDAATNAAKKRIADKLARFRRGEHLGDNDTS
jgi:hypothetical protein